MRIFVTGASGFVGSAVIKELIREGHQVLGLARSDKSAAAVAASGAEVYRGDVTDLECLKHAAGQSDGVIHTAFNHDFSKYAEVCEEDRRAIEALGAALVGSDRPFVVTSGTAIADVAPGRLASEDSPALAASVMPRAASEEAAIKYASLGVNVSVVRLPQVHDPVKHGLISFAIQIAREKGASAYIGAGDNRWPAAHVDDVARLYRLALEKRERGSIYNAVAEEGVAFKTIAETIGRGLNLPVQSISGDEAQDHFTWLAMFVSRDLAASGKLTQQRLDWHPTGPGIISDLERMDYFAAVS
jgi:nucleoside-diphosphate-sugar epimerase